MGVYDNSNVKVANAHLTGFGDMSNMQHLRGLNESGWYEATHYDTFTNGWFITFASDVPDDTDVYPSADKALATLFPCYRVHVMRTGEVRVIEVKRSLPPGAVFATLATDPDTGVMGPGQVWGPNFWYNNMQAANPISEASTNASVRATATWLANQWATKTQQWYDAPRSADDDRSTVRPACHGLRPVRDAGTAEMVADAMSTKPGFTLVEVLCCVLVLGMGLAAVIGMIHYGNRLAARAMAESTAWITAHTVAQWWNGAPTASGVVDWSGTGGYINGYWVSRTSLASSVAVAGGIVEDSARADVYDSQAGELLASAVATRLRKP